MLFWILQQIILSLILIILVHYIYIFFKNNLTTPKIKDLVNKPSQQYNEIYKSMTANEKGSDTNSSKKMMKTELTNYLKSLSAQQKKEKVIPGDNAFSNNFSSNYETVSTL